MSEKERMKIASGEEVDALAPVIVSASRSTDVPAFYAEWFFRRLEAGYCVWHNPFNKKPSCVSFSKCRAVVFWTKNPKPILPYLAELDRRGIHYYFQFTLNDYESEGFEPNVPPLDERIETFRELSRRIGKERVIWRFDPLIATERLTPAALLEKIRRVGEAIKGCTEKLVFSFVDVKAYRKVQNNLVRDTGEFDRSNVVSAEMTEEQRRELVEGLVELKRGWKRDGWEVELATCGEEFNYIHYGIKHNRCIDGELMLRTFGEDMEFAYYLQTGKWPVKDLFGEIPPVEKRKDLKDKGQRKACGCMVSKDIGTYNTCRHFCIYCYANTSRDCVEKNAAKHNADSESIIG